MRMPFWLLLLLLCGCENLRREPESVWITLDGHEFNLDLALDTASRTLGLKGVTEIPESGGMLFVFPESALRSFWMEACLVDIDIIFVDGQGRVTATHRMKAEAPRRSDETQAQYEGRLRHYSSVYPAQFAIELRAGWLDKLDIRVESKLELDLPSLKALPR